jgi:predicted transcriptional regulator
VPKPRYTGRGGPNNRPLRYPVVKTVKLSQTVSDTLDEMARRAGRGVTPMTLMRRAINAQVYIYKAKNKSRRKVDEELNPDEQDTSTSSENN